MSFVFTATSFRCPACHKTVKQGGEIRLLKRVGWVHPACMKAAP